jgi:hypothetical protein
LRVRRLRNGELLESSTVAQERIARARFIRESLEGIGQFAPRLQGTSIVEIRAELEEIGRELCEGLAREAAVGEPAPCEKADAGEAEKDETE